MILFKALLHKNKILLHKNKILLHKNKILLHKFTHMNIYPNIKVHINRT